MLREITTIQGIICLVGRRATEVEFITIYYCMELALNTTIYKEWFVLQEEELRKQNSARAAHLHEDLHVEVVAFATPAEAYARLALALNQLRLYLVPDTNDQVSEDTLLLSNKHTHTFFISAYLLYYFILCVISTIKQYLGFTKQQQFIYFKLSA